MAAVEVPQILEYKGGQLNAAPVLEHVNTEILKENKNLRTELKELITITKTWFNSSNKVNQCISEQIPSQKNRILGVDQLTEDPSSAGQKDLVFVKSLADDTKILPAESQRNIIGPSVAVTDSSATDYDSADESLICSAPLLTEKLEGAATSPAKGNKNSSASKANLALAGKLKSVKIEDDPPLAIIIKELNNLKLQFSKKREINLRNPQHAFKRYESYGSSTHTTTDHYDIEWFKRGEALQAKKAEALKSTRLNQSNANRSA
ncbi:hypothetical protein Tco_0584089 [Tanacetum coccineum]